MRNLLMKIYNYNEVLSSSVRDNILKHKRRVEYFIILIPVMFIIAGYTFDSVSRKDYTNFKLLHRFSQDYIHKVNLNILPIGLIFVAAGLFIITLYRPKIIYSFWSTLIIFSLSYALIPEADYYTIEFIYQTGLLISKHKTLIFICLPITAIPLAMYSNVRNFTVMTIKNGAQLFLLSSISYLEIVGHYKPFFFLETFASLFINSIRLFGGVWDIVITLFVSLIFISLYSKKALSIAFFIRNKLSMNREMKLARELGKHSELELTKVSEKVSIPLLKHGNLPKLGVIVPAFNESSTISDTVDSLMNIDYSKSSFLVIVVSDGSTDGTVNILRDKYNMQQTHINQTTNFIPHKQAREMYVSSNFSNLVVIDKPNGGKSDALNLGLEYLPLDIEYVSVIDADSIVDKHAFRILSTRAERDNEVAALTGTVLPRKHEDPAGFKSTLLKNVQLFDYLSSFHGERGALGLLNSILIIPGAFGFFRRNVLMSLKGYPQDVLAEDGLLTLNIHKEKAKVGFVPEAVSHTQVPSTFKDLRKQRMRWFKGLTEMLTSLGDSWGENFKLTFVFLDYLFIEWITPILVPIGICVVIANPEMLTYTTFQFFMLLAIVTPVIQGTLCLLMETSYRKINPSKLLYLPLVVIMSPLMVLWRNDALLDIRNRKWGEIRRY